MTARGSRGSSLAVSVLVTLLTVAGAIVLVVRLPGRAGEIADKAAAQPLAVSASPAPASPSARPSRAVASPAVRHHRKPSPSMTATTAVPSPSPSASATTARPGSTPPPASPTAAGQVLALINQARAQAGLPAYTISSGLDTSAGRHNAVMAGGCGLSHQCPGEPDLGARETAAGVAWTAAGENIGEGGPVADTGQRSPGWPSG